MNGKVRYFQLHDGTSDAVVCSTAVNPDHTHDTSPEWTEVQVVPLDAVVVNLPEVRRAKGGGWLPVGPLSDIHSTPRYADHSTAELNSAEEYVLLLLSAIHAEREHREAHPPVDKAQVAAVTAIIDEDEAWGEDGSSATLARRLVERGVKVELP